MTDKTLLVWGDIHSAVRVWQKNDAVMHFEVLNVVGFTNTTDATPIYWPTGQDSPHPATQDPDSALVEVDGFIKFDGCSHWAYAEGHAQHICGTDDLDNFQTTQRRLFDEAKRRIPTWSEE